MEPAPQPHILPRCRSAPDRPHPAALPTLRAGPAFVIAPSRCNRCGACLRLGCGAILDLGDESLVVDAAACSGCAACAPVCRARAIAPVVADAVAAP